MRAGGALRYAHRAVDVPRTLSESFLADLAEPVRRGLADHEVATVAALVGQWDAAVAAWQGIDVAPEHFGREIARRIGAVSTAAAALAAIETMRGGDVYLAVACCDGDSAAIARFEDMLARELRHVAAKLHASPDQTTEIHAELRRILLVEEPTRRAALREFAGRGDLRGYIRVMATRALIRTINRGRREIAIDDADFFDRMLPYDDAEISFLRAQYRDAVDAALRAALAGLDARSRALLRFQLIDGWSIDQVGKLYGVHRATAARWLTEAREVLGTAIRTELAARLQISPEEVDSIVRLVQSRVDMSLERLLLPEASG